MHYDGQITLSINPFKNVVLFMLYPLLVVLCVVVGDKAAGEVFIAMHSQALPLRTLPPSEPQPRNQTEEPLNLYVCIHMILHSHVSYIMMKKKRNT